MHRAGALTAAVVSWLALALPTGASAQEPATAEAAPVEEAPSAIPVAEIALRADALGSRLREVAAQVAAAEVEEAVEAELAVITEELESAQSRLEQALERPGTSLDALRSVWERLNRRLTTQTGQLGDRARELDTFRAEIREATERWRLTRNAARAGSAPQAVVDRAVEAVRKLLAADTDLVAQRNVALDLQARVAERQHSIEPALERIDAQSAELAASFLVRQHEPIWRGGFRLEGARAELSRIAADLDQMGADVLSYSQLHRGRLALQLLIVLALGWVFSRARAMPERQAQDEAGGESSAAIADALRHPWEAALLFGLLLSFILHPERVRGFQLVVALLALPLWLRVFRSLLPPALRAPVLGIAALALAELVRFAVVGFDLVFRSLLLLDLAAGFAGVLWLRRPEHLRHVPEGLGRGLWFRVLDGWLQLIGVAFGVGLVAAILGYSNLADRIALVAVWGSVFGAAWLAVVRTFEAVAESVIEAGKLDFVRMVESERPRVRAGLRRSLRGLGFLAWVYLILSATQLWSPIVAGLGSVLGARVGYGSFGLSLGGVLAFGLTLYLSWQLARFTSFALDEEVFSRVRLPPGVPNTLATFSRYAIFVGGFVAALAMVGFSWDSVSLLVASLGVGIGFGLQNVINNFVSGIIMLFERPVRIGDRVQLDDLLGVVTAINLRASKVRTFDGSDVLVPNGDFISARVINWTLSDERRRVTLPVRAPYGTKPRQVLEILEQVARANPEVLHEPAPEALFRGFGESALDFELRAWTESERGFLAVLSDLAVATGEALEAAGIRIPFPQQDLHLRNAPELGNALAEALRRDHSAGSDETS